MQTEDKGLISIIMPAYNVEKYVEDSIISVLNQSYGNFELIIINDGSKDNTLNIIEKLALKDSRIRLINNEVNIGCAESRNLGLKNALGYYVAFCDSDDIWESKKLEIQLDFIHKHNVDMVFSAYKMIDNCGTLIKYKAINTTVTLEDLLDENFIIFSTTIFKYSSIENIRFLKNWFHEDYVYLLECLNKGLKFTAINEYLVQYRIHNNGRSFNKIKSAKHRWKIYREYLGLSVYESLKHFIWYSLNGLKKYI